MTGKRVREQGPHRRAASGQAIVIVTTSDGVAGQIARQFETAGYVAIQTTSGEATLELAGERRPSLIVLDLDEGDDLSGYEVYHELRQRFDKSMLIILLSGTRTEPPDRLAGLLIGADDYVTKPFEPGEILARAQRFLAPPQSQVPPLEMPLTARELEVLQLLSDGFSQERIAKELFISSKTVGTHVQRILTKFAVHSRAEAVALAYRYGLIRSVKPDETTSEAT